MADQKFREIQLGGKQIVFLFMAALVVAVAVFLLGISVGRGVRSASGDSAGTEVAVAAPQGAPVDMPPPTVTTPADLQYHDQLQGQNTPPAQASPAAPVATAAETPGPTADAPPAVAEPSSKAGSSRAPAVTAKLPPAAKPVEKVVEKTPVKADAPAAAAGSGWFVQVNAFKSRENAERQVASLRAKGFSAAAVSPSGGLFRVRVGPFAQRSDADQTVARLKREEGLTSSVQR